MAQWTAHTTSSATPEQVLAVLTHPEEIRRRSPAVLSAGALEGAAGRIASAAELAHA